MMGWMCRKRAPDVTQRVILGRHYDFYLVQKKNSGEHKTRQKGRTDGGGKISRNIEVEEEPSVCLCVCVCVLLSLSHPGSNRWRRGQCIIE